MVAGRDSFYLEGMMQGVLILFALTGLAMWLGCLLEDEA